MRGILEKIKEANCEELQEIMSAIEKRYAVIFPEWEVTYMAVHKQYKFRRRDTQYILKMLKYGLRQSKKQSKKATLR